MAALNMRSAALAACALGLQAASAVLNPPESKSSPLDAEQQRVRSRQQMLIVLNEVLPDKPVKTDDWFDNVLFQQPETAFIRDLRMSKRRFAEVRCCFWRACYLRCL